MKKLTKEQQNFVINILSAVVGLSVGCCADTCIQAIIKGILSGQNMKPITKMACHIGSAGIAWCVSDFVSDSIFKMLKGFLKGYAAINKPGGETTRT